MAWPTEAGSVARHRRRSVAARPTLRPRSSFQRSTFFYTSQEVATYSQVREGLLTVVTVTGTLTGDDVRYHWYIDGVHVAMTTLAEYAIALEPLEQAVLVVIETDNPDFDFVAEAPTGHPARRTISWPRSTDSTTAYYVVEQEKDSAAWVEIGRFAQNDEWSFRLLTPRLDDLASYQWRIVPYDAADNAGTASAGGLDIQAGWNVEPILRTPDAPNFTAKLNTDTTVTLDSV